MSAIHFSIDYDLFPNYLIIFAPEMKIIKRTYQLIKNASLNVTVFLLAMIVAIFLRFSKDKEL